MTFGARPDFAATTHGVRMHRVEGEARFAVHRFGHDKVEDLPAILARHIRDGLTAHDIGRDPPLTVGTHGELAEGDENAVVGPSLAWLQFTRQEIQALLRSSRSKWRPKQLGAHDVWQA